ncbi:hypothetical protein MKW94_006138 [Papaver nudicaule]|uniref:40S ribosomal protein S30 n=1 Tax=Papaver nudicaule TaxID=74823 RepID=A0AA41VFI8_PAPNU|nr:hypothetical protein [Papaver nudicaule]
MHLRVFGSCCKSKRTNPKVAKQDEEKKPRGRAHKRMQYNRHFVSAEFGNGKPKFYSTLEIIAFGRKWRKPYL